MPKPSAKQSEKLRPQDKAVTLEFEAAPKAAQALRLRRLGYTYARIAEEMGYKSESSARSIVKKSSQKLVREEARELIAMQLDHLDEALQVVLKRVTADNAESLWAVDRLVPLLKRQAELMGLDAQASAATLTVPNGKRVIIEDMGAADRLPPALELAAGRVVDEDEPDDGDDDEEVSGV